jgi:hypothetical protein
VYRTIYLVSQVKSTPSQIAKRRGKYVKYGGGIIPALFDFCGIFIAVDVVLSPHI